MSKKGDSAFKLGKQALNAKNYAEGVKQFKIATKKGVKQYKMSVAWHDLGLCHMHLGQYEEAHKNLDKALALDPELVHSWNAKGVTFRREGKMEEARECYQRTLSINPNEPDGLTNMGYWYIKQGMPDEAIAILLRAVEVEPQYGLHHANLAHAYALKGRFADADASMRLSVSLGYDNWKSTHKVIEELKELAEATSASPIGNPAPSGASTARGAWLPPVCPRCGAPTSADRVQWIDDFHAKCSFCGTGISQAGA